MLDSTIQTLISITTDEKTRAEWRRLAITSDPEAAARRFNILHGNIIDTIPSALCREADLDIWHRLLGELRAGFYPFRQCSAGASYARIKISKS